MGQGAERWRRPAMVPAAPATQTPVVCDPRDWLSRQGGECAYPVAGESCRTLSCCNPSGDQPYCPAHRAAVYRQPVPR